MIDVRERRLGINQVGDKEIEIGSRLPKPQFERKDPRREQHRLASGIEVNDRLVPTDRVVSGSDPVRRRVKDTAGEQDDPPEALQPLQ